MNKKVIIGIVIVVIIAIVAGLFLFNSADLTLVAGDAQVTVPGNSTVDKDGVAHYGDIGITFTPIVGLNESSMKEMFDAFKSNGADAGYCNVTTGEVNGYKTYEFNADPTKLKTVSSDKVASGDYETWNEYDPYIPYKGITDMKVVKFRYIGFVKDGSIKELCIFTNNTGADLYSSDMANIINSISAAEK